ncbi:MAG: SDR family oxidoreductase [Thermoanaerobaculia bacterium]|nr:SDR family oxidoreductase [Thermoanaerobaculia bacterium]
MPLAPGATLAERTLQEMPDYEAIWSRLMPVGRPAQPADIDRAALYLLSPESLHFNCQTLVVDGGWTAISPGPG